MENTTKKTKAMYFNEIRELVMNTVEDETQREDIVAFIDKQLETLDKRRVAAAARAEEKRAKSDELTTAIYERLGNEFMTVDDILATFDDETVTRSKITARLGKLVKAEEVVKEAVKGENGNKKMAYKLAE